MSEPTWQILIASAYARHAQLEQLLRRLHAQLEPYDGRVSILVFRDDCEVPIGEKRQCLLEWATADYVSFVDDDDDVADDYIARIVSALDDRPDYVGFNVEYSVGGFVQKPVRHDLMLRGWYETPVGYYRDISHLNPIRRDVALAGLPFEGHFGEDGRWADRIRETGLARTQIFLDGEPLYKYRYLPNGTLFGNGRRCLGEEPPALRFGHTHFYKRELILNA